MRKNLPLHDSASAAWHSAFTCPTIFALRCALCWWTRLASARNVVKRVGQSVRTAPVSG